ncbi:MAG: transcription termination/antitermination protein NusG [bacterium]|nr:transcription termination/antitermination protein NusG [bacterium]
MMEKQEKRWYIIQTYSGFEDSVERDLKKRIETMEMQDYIFNVLIPTETIVETKADGSKKEKVKKMFPGYIFVEMIVTDESWFIVRNTPKVTGFLGSSGGGTKPVPLPPEEVANVFKKAGIVPQINIDFEVGDMVEIVSGSMAGKIVEVTDIDLVETKATVLVEMFGRQMDFQVDLSSLKKAQ